MFYAFLITFAATLTSVEKSPVPGQAPAGSYQLAAVQVPGAKRYTPSDVVRLSGLKIGQSITVAELAPAAERLAASGLFKSLKYKYISAARRMTVTFEIEEADWTVPVTFDNFVWFTDEQVTGAVAQDVPTFDGTAPPAEGVPDLVVHSLQKLLDAHNIRGRASFAPKTELATGKLEYVFSVEDAPLTLCAIAFKGVSAAPERELLDATRSAIGTAYSRAYWMEMSKGTLLDVLHRRGYWRASFPPPTVSVDPPGCTGVGIALPVNEGASYTFDKAEWNGNAVLKSAELDALLRMKPGEVADSSRVDAGLVRVRQAYGRNGYLQESAVSAPRLDDEAKRAVFEVKIQEGPQFHMGALQFDGLSEADANRLRKTWTLQPGSVYDDSYPQTYLRKEVFPLLRQGATPPSTKVEIDPDKRLVNVTVAFQR